MSGVDTDDFRYGGVNVTGFSLTLSHTSTVNKTDVYLLTLFEVLLAFLSDYYYMPVGGMICLCEAGVDVDGRRHLCHQTSHDVHVE